jgi:hypothetical protein
MMIKMTVQNNNKNIYHISCENSILPGLNGQILKGLNISLISKEYFSLISSCERLGQPRGCQLFKFMQIQRYIASEVSYEKYKPHCYGNI